MCLGMFELSSTQTFSWDKAEILSPHITLFNENIFQVNQQFSAKYF